MTILRRHYTMNWQENFTTKVLERGFEYYENGNILEIMKTTSGYKAKVEGSGYDEYDVRVEIEDDEIKDMNCTCIYGQEMGCCKHMAAVLYAIDEGEDIEEEIDTEEIIKSLSKTKLQQMMLSVSDNEEIKYKLKLISGSDPYTILKHKLERIIRKYAGLTGEIETYDLYSFSEKILNFLEQDVYGTEDEYWRSKIECICCVLDELNKLELDDSEEDVWIMYNTCYEMLGTILSKDTTRLSWIEGAINPIYFREFMDTINI